MGKREEDALSSLIKLGRGTAAFYFKAALFVFTLGVKRARKSGGECRHGEMQT